MGKSLILQDAIWGLIQKTGMSQADFARQVGMQPAQLSIFLSGKSDIHSSRLVAILDHLGVDLLGMLAKASPKKHQRQNISVCGRQLSQGERSAVEKILFKLSEKRTKAMLRGEFSAFRNNDELS